MSSKWGLQREEATHDDVCASRGDLCSFVWLTFLNCADRVFSLPRFQAGTRFKPESGGTLFKPIRWADH
jgi:hypothetical protein